MSVKNFPDFFSKRPANSIHPNLRPLKTNLSFKIMVLAHNIQEGDRTQDVKISDDITFYTMLLANSTLEGLSKSGFLKPSPIQLHSIPLGKCGFDLLLEAKSGTGKTAVFTIIALEKLDLSKGLQTVILAPTREIASQVCDVIKQIGSGYQHLCVEVVMGGLPVEDDIAKLKKKTHIIVGSPGRLRHLIQDKHMDVSAVRLLVLDEADKLMDKSFLADINYIFSILPQQKQVIMSSATYHDSLRSVISKYVQNSQHICPDSTSILIGIKHLFTIVKSNTNIVRQTQYRFEELLNILSKHQFKQCLIFCNYQVRVGELCKMLIKEKWPAAQLHGQQEQTDRLKSLKTLQEFRCRILVSTDLAARGIDALNVDLVINFEPPFEWQTYLHRIGRAGRFGSYGIAVTILSEGQEKVKFKKMLKAINVSLDLRNLWDADQFFIEDQNMVSTNDNVVNGSMIDECNNTQTNDNKCIQLWDVLTQENLVKNNDEFFNFEELNQSYKNFEQSKVDSFNDLLISYDSYQDSNEETNSYQYVKFHKIDIWNSNNFNKHNDSDISEKINNELIDTETICVKATNKLDSEENSNERTNKFEISSKIPRKDTNKHIIHTKEDSTTEMNKTENFDYILKRELLCLEDMEDTNRALLEAGLPTSFGKKKINNMKSVFKNIKKNKNIEKTDLNLNHRMINEHDSQENIEKPVHTHLKYEYDNSEDESHINACIAQSYRKNSWRKTDTYNVRATHYKSINHCGNNYACFNINSSNIKKYSNSSYEKYVLWYNKLKKHTRQVEMALYIQEYCRM